MPEIQQLDLAVWEEAAQKELAEVNLPTIQRAIDMIVVGDQEAYERAIAYRNKASEARRAVFDMLEGLRASTYKTYKDVMALRDKLVGPWEKAELKANAKINAYLRDAEAAKQKMATVLEQQAQEKRKELQEQSRELLGRGYVQQAETLRMQAQVLQAPILPSAVDKVAGNRVKPTFTTTCKDPMALIKAIAAGECGLMHEDRNGEMRPILEVSQVVLNAITSRQLGATSIPGCVTDSGYKSSPTKL
jgi:hypothetical protein